MTLTNEFIDAVNDKRMIRVRIMLKDSMLVDPSLNDYNEMLDYANSKLDDLYDNHDGEKLSYEMYEWNENYLNDQMVKVVNNFSKERLELLCNIVRKLYGKKYEEEKIKYQAKSYMNKKQIGTGAMAVGVVATVTGICLSETVLVAGGIAVTAAGAVMIITDK